MLFDMDLKELAVQATNKQFQYEHANLKNKRDKNNAALDFIETTKAGLTDFNLAIDSIRHKNGGVVKNKAIVSQANMANVKIKDYATTDSVSVFVTQLASAHEIALDGLDNTKLAAEQSVIPLKIGSKVLNVDFSKINTIDQLMNAINQHGDNNDTLTNDNLVGATVRRINGSEWLVLKSNNTGENNKIEFTAPTLFVEKEITKPQDAKLKLGGELLGIEVVNSSNTFDDLIKNSSITLTSIHKTGELPLTITIKQDASATETQVSQFADAVNAIQKIVKYDKDSPNPYTSGLHRKINALTIEPINGKRLIDFGFTFEKNGLLKVDNKRLLAEIEKNPTSINDFFNHKDGLITKLDALLDPYLKGDKWSLDIEKHKLSKNEENFSNLADKFDEKYAYALNVNQNKFNEMERVMARMEDMLNMFDFEEKKR
ncbi:flagellar filament capping protein FliD [Yersinia enterocolitica]